MLVICQKIASSLPLYSTRFLRKQVIYILKPCMEMSAQDGPVPILVTLLPGVPSTYSKSAPRGRIQQCHKPVIGWAELSLQHDGFAKPNEHTAPPFFNTALGEQFDLFSWAQNVGTRWQQSAEKKEQGIPHVRHHLDLFTVWPCLRRWPRLYVRRGCDVLTNPLNYYHKGNFVL